MHWSELDLGPPGHRTEKFVYDAGQQLSEADDGRGLMSPDPISTAQQALRNALAVGRRLSAEARAARPLDQPHDPTARLTRVDWALGSAGGVVVQNLEALFSGGHCRACLIPLGARTSRRMKVSYHDSLSRRCDGVVAQLPERPAGPAYRLYTERVRSLIPREERRGFRWRPVTVVNPTKTTPQLYELVGSAIHVEVVALRGGNPDQSRCAACGRGSLPSYPLVGHLPDWLNPGGDHVWRGQPSTYVAAEGFPERLPVWYTLGDWCQGVELATSRPPWESGARRSPRGVSPSALGVVTRDLVEEKTPRPV